MGHLFYTELGGVAGQSITTAHNTSFNLFNNVQSLAYWSSTEFASDPNNAWNFGTMNGFQANNFKVINQYAWAVRTGDVTSVPEPSIIWLLVAGGAGWFGTKARRRG